MSASPPKADIGIAAYNPYVWVMIKSSTKGTHSVNGIQIKCQICENERLDKRKVQLNTTGMTLFGLDWANKNADVLTCRKCGYLHWFKN